MRILAAIAALLLVFSTLQDCFETIVLPRRVARKLRMTRLFYRLTWLLWSAPARKMKSNGRREYYLSFYGPLSLLFLLSLWAGLLIFAFGLLQWSLGSALNAPEKTVTIFTDLYMSGTTFFTLGLGDVVPREGLARLATVSEGGMGLAFLALVIGYVPVIYQAFSRREVQISLLDARAGSPPSAAELLRRHIESQSNVDELTHYLRSWETWSADILESHISYPVLTYYRSQHERQSWLGALTTILDVSALVMIELDGVPAQVGKFTFAITRHAAVDLAQAFNTPPIPPKKDRLSSDNFARLRTYLAEAGIHIKDEATAEAKLLELRNLYEPYVNALANHLLVSLPDWITEYPTADDWQTSAWDHFSMTTQKPLRKIK